MSKENVNKVPSDASNGDISNSAGAKGANRIAGTGAGAETGAGGVNTSARTSTPARVNFVNIPSVLKSSCSFCLWRKEKRNGKPTKVPYDPKTGQMAKTNDPSTFSDFATAMKMYAFGSGTNQWDGIGFRVSEGIGAIDIDHCIRPDGSLNDVAVSVLSFLKNGYFERSPSGTGLRGFFRLDSDFTYDKTRYYVNNRKFGLEVYLPGVTNRFVTITGDVYRTGEVELSPESIKDLQSVLDTFMKRRTQVINKIIKNPVSYFTDEQVINHASNTNNEDSNEKFKDLMAGNWEERYDSQSDADMALVSMLCFWCGCVEEQIDRIFRSSGLMRDKWDRITGDGTYGTITIRNAVSTCREIYRPTAYSGVPAEKDFTAINSRDNEDNSGDNEYNSGGNENNGSKRDERDERCEDGEGIEVTTISTVDAIQAERDRRESEGYAFTPDYRCLHTTIDALNPHLNPRYETFQIGNSLMFLDYYRSIILMNDRINASI